MDESIEQPIDDFLLETLNSGNEDFEQYNDSDLNDWID